MAGLWQESWVAARTLARRPGWAVVTAGTVALGVGSATAMFALVEGVLLRPLAYEEPDRLVHVFQTSPELGWERGPVSFPNFDDWRREADAFRELGAYHGVRETLAGDVAPRPVRGSRVSGELLGLLGVEPLHGRLLGPADEGPGAAPAVVLSHALWRDAFGADPGVVGEPVTLGDTPHTVVGVMPPDFPPLSQGDQLWTAMPYAAAEMERDASFLRVLGRLRPGVTPAEAETRMEALVRRIERVHPGGNEGRHAHVETRAAVVTGDMEEPLLLLLAAVGLLLLIACANLAGLTLIRGDGRRRELAVRAALGAGRGALVRGLFLESLAVAALGALLALPLARVLVDGVLAFGPGDLPRRGEIGLNAWSVAFALGATGVSAVLFGLLPALRAGRGTDLQAELREGGGRGFAGRMGPVQAGLVVVQVALAVVLLTGAGLLGRSLLALQAVDRGFDGRGVLTFRVGPPSGSYGSMAELDAFYREIEAGLGSLPGVDAVGATWSLPFAESYGSTTYRVEGDPTDETYPVQLVPVRGDYLDAMGIDVLEGRGFTMAELAPGSSASDSDGGVTPILVNRTLAERAWPGGGAVGRRFVRGEGASAELLEVVGVLPDVALMSVGEEPVAQSFLPHTAAPWARELYVTARTTAPSDGAAARIDPLELVPAVRRVVAGVDERVPVADVATMRGRLSAQLAAPRFRTLLVVGFAVAAALLALLGIYGVTAFVVARRTREIGIRMALGAARSKVLTGVIARAGLLAAAGCVLGIAGGAVGARSLEGLLYRTPALDPVVHGGAVALILLATLAACLGPARRASAVAPSTVLREQ